VARSRAQLRERVDVRVVRAEKVRQLSLLDKLNSIGHP
jgi:hypothetical protein